MEVCTVPPIPRSLSIVLPLPDDRGYAERAVIRWLQQPEPVELIVLGDGSNPRLERRIRTMLRPGDRLVIESGASEAEMYDRGARLASADLLLLTESHCIAAPDAACGIVRFFAESGAEAAWLESGHISDSPFARMEERLHEEDLANRPDADDWRHISLRGFALRKSLFVEAGGLPAEFGRFAEALLAIRIQRAGRRLHAIPGNLIRHGNCDRYAELSEALRGHGRGQALYWHRQELGAVEKFHHPSPDWSGRAALHRPAARALCRMALRALESGPGGPGWAGIARESLRVLRRQLPPALLGPRAGLLRAKAASFAWRVRCLATSWNDDRLYPNYRRLWTSLVRVGVLEQVCRTPQPQTLTLPPDRERSSIGEAVDGALAGFHAREDWGPESCRWTFPMSLVHVSIPRGDYRIRLRGNSPWPASSDGLRIFFNGHPIAPASIARAEDGLEFPVSKDMFASGPEQRIGLACRPFVPRRRGLPDDRRLGLLLFSIGFEAVVAQRDWSPDAVAEARRDAADPGGCPRNALLRAGDSLAASGMLAKRLVQRSPATPPRRLSALPLSRRPRRARDGPFSDSLLRMRSTG